MENKNLGAANMVAVLVILVVIGAGLVFALTRNNEPAAENNQSAQNSQNNTNTGAMDRVEVPLAAQNNSGQSGKVTLTDEGGKTKIVIEVASGPAGLAQPAHVHTGTCAKGLGAVKYPLNPVVNGRSETTITPSLHFLHGLGELGINVHKSESEVGTYVSCGDLLPAFNAAMGITGGSVQGAIQSEGTVQIGE